MLDRDDIGESQRKQTRPRFQVETVVRARVKLLNTHGFQLTVERFNALAIVGQIVIIRPGVSDVNTVLSDRFLADSHLAQLRRVHADSIRIATVTANADYEHQQVEDSGG